MKKTVFLFGMLGVSILFAGCGSQPTPTPENIGGAQDEHGCYTAAGYSWSEEQQECVRPWEVGTGTTGDETLLGGDRDEHGCVPSAGYSRSEELQECVRLREINQTGTNTSGSESTLTREAVDAKLAEYATCEKDEDCATFYGKCPLGCWQAVNNEYLEKAQALVEEYSAGLPEQCMYKCMEISGAKCESGKCVAY